jgi:hypothetical protein
MKRLMIKCAESKGKNCQIGLSEDKRLDRKTQKMQKKARNM